VLFTRNGVEANSGRVSLVRGESEEPEAVFSPKQKRTSGGICYCFILKKFPLFVYHTAMSNETIAFVLGIFPNGSFHRSIQNDVTDVHRRFPDFLQYPLILDHLIDIHKKFENQITDFNFMQS